MKLIAMTLASLSLLASSVAHADPSKAREDVSAVAPSKGRGGYWNPTDGGAELVQWRGRCGIATKRVSKYDRIRNCHPDECRPPRSGQRVRRIHAVTSRRRRNHCETARSTVVVLRVRVFLPMTQSNHDQGARRRGLLPDRLSGT